MNAQYFDRARAAYRAGDFSAAAQMFSAAKEPGELAGEADHLRGNSLMRLGLYADAAEAYAAALSADLAAVEAKIEAASGARPLAFAYPFGFHCDETEALLRARGYLLALTCENRVDDVAPGEGLLTLGRFNRSANLGREEFFALLGIK